jgi:hypothetical protein
MLTRTTTPVTLIPLNLTHTRFKPQVKATVLGNEVTLEINNDIPSNSGFDPLDDAIILENNQILLYIDQVETIWRVETPELRDITITNIVRH